MWKASAEEKLANDSSLSLMHLKTVEPDFHPKISQDLVCHLQSFMTLDGSLSSKLFSGRNTYASDAACALSVKKETCLLVLFLFQGLGDLLGNMLQFDWQCK